MHESPSRIDPSIPQIAWMNQLAAGLVADAGLAEDLVQDAWVQYLSRPPRPSGSQRAWFRQVLRNLARYHWRRERRREDLEQQLHVEQESEATSELVARARAQQALVDEVLALEAPYRDVLMLRYFEELESPAIATRLGIPASTVRTHLQRGLERLRMRLESRHGASARDWLPALLPLLPRPPGLRAGAAASGTAAGSAPVLTWVAAASVLLALLAALAYFARSGDEADRLSRVSELTREPSTLADAPGVAKLEVPRASSPPSTRSQLGGEAPAEATPEPEPIDGVAAVAPEPRTVVEVRVDGRAAVKGVVHLQPERRWIVPGGEGEGRPTHQRAVGPGGRAVFEGLELRDGAAGLELFPGAAVLQTGFHDVQSREPILLQVGTARIEGRVWDVEGLPAAGVEVTLGVKIGYDYGALSSRTYSRADGRFEFEGLPAESFWLYAAFEAAGENLRTHGELREGEIRSVDLGHPRGRLRLAGRLVDLDGRALAATDPDLVRVLVFARLDQGDDRQYFPAQLGRDGSYAVQLPAGDYAVTRQQNGLAFSQGIAERISVVESGELDLVMPGIRVQGVVRVVGLGTPLEPDTDGPAVLHLVREDEQGRETRFECYAGPGGRFSFEGIEPGRWELVCDRQVDDQPYEVVLVESDRERTVDVLVR